MGVPWDLIQGWDQRCGTHHNLCNQNRSNSAWYPTRLLDLGAESDTVYLRLTSQNLPQSAYMTLSHRWGDANMIQTTSTNIGKMLGGISVQRLPKTFKDAIEVCKRFGIRYLWIDSLCIVQDVTADWIAESATMGDVYTNSYCNISATAVSSSNEGLFLPRNERIIHPHSLQYGWAGRSPEPYVIVEEQFWNERIREAPLNARAWVVQERYLAPKTLHFGIDQVLWECLEQDVCEAFPNGLPSLVSESNLTKFKLRDGEINDALLKSSSRFRVCGHGDYQLWTQLLAFYTSCDLTNKSDKLIALSGLAKLFQNKLEDTYHAGLWRKTLERDLLWCVDDTRPARPEEYRAPSWSWAALDSKILLLSTCEPSTPIVTILDIQTFPVSDDSMGQIRGGYIHLRGRLIDGTLDCLLDEWNSELARGKATIDVANVQFDYILPDVWPQNSSSEAVKYLPIFYSTSGTEGSDEDEDETPHSYVDPELDDDVSDGSEVDESPDVDDGPDQAVDMIDDDELDGDGAKVVGLILKQVVSSANTYTRLGFFNATIPVACSIFKAHDTCSSEDDIMII